MKNPNDGPGLPPAVLEKLNEVRKEDRRVRFQTGLRRSLAVLLMTMLSAMIIDRLAVLHEDRWRWTLTVLALACPAATFILWCLPPLLKSRSLDSIARDIDQAHPGAEERFRTLVGLSQTQDSPELRGSAELTEKVAQQTAEMSGGIAVNSVVSTAGLRGAGRLLCGGAGVLALLFLADFQQTKTLFLRFWAPSADITMTKLVVSPGDAMVGRGDDVNLQITAGGKAPKEVVLSIRSGTKDEDIRLQPVSAKEAKFLYAMYSVGDSFDYRASAGDGQTAWHHVTVMDRPKISQVKLRIVPPAYSRLPVVDQDGLPRHLRALEGSQLEASFQTDQALAAMNLRFADGSVAALSELPDHTYHFSTTLTNTLAFTPVFTNLHHLDNAAKPTCEVIVYPDHPPTVSVITPDSAITARHDDKVKIDFEARDDIGLAKAELVLSIKGETNAVEKVIPIPLTQNEEGARQIRKQVELDLSKLNVKQDQELSYFVRVTDTKENAAVNEGEKPGPAGKPAAQATGDGKKHLAMNSPPAKPKAAEGAGGSKPPPNSMPKRVLDAGQCSSCEPMKIVVDDWGRSYEGQMRDKLEIAIDPVLKQLDELLGHAQKLTDATLAVGRSDAGLGEKERPALHEARENLRQSDSAVSELKKRTAGTAYAFIGLQVDDIRGAHISPARQRLADVALESAELKNDRTNLQEASFQIKLARQALADLTKTYEAVKRDNKLSDAMQRLAKMHRIFLEDTQAMLNSKKPVLNQQERKIAEVSDDYAAKLEKLLEEQKKIMAELSKILANDPRLLRRFMAVEELDGTTLRDQMTLLAERQQTLARFSARWTNAPEKDRPAFLNEMGVAQSGEQNEIAAMTSKLLENIATWAPIDIPVDKEPILSCRKYAAEAARLSGDAAQHLTPDTIQAGLTAAGGALEQLRKLQGKLPALDWIMESRENVSAFEANRLNDTAALITRQSGWIKKMEALRAGDYAEAAAVDQHRLMLDTTTLGEKLDATAISLASLSAGIKLKADELNTTLHREILPAESGAVDALLSKTMPAAAGHQVEATNAFAKGEQQFDELLRMIIAKLDAEPPPTDPMPNKSLEQMLAELKQEQKACEKLGVPCRPLNVQVLKDWMKPGSCSNPGEAQARAVEAGAKKAAETDERLRDESKRLAMLLEKALPQLEHEHPNKGPKPPPASWNTLVSKLGDELRQGRDNVPPEQYRQAIEQYFNTISEKPADSSPAETH